MKKNLKLFLLTVLGTWMAGSAMALSQDGNGVYQIANGDDLVAFANMVNGDNSKSGVSAVLTADIDLSGKDYPTIGRDGSRFWGTFDGQGHRIKNMSIVGTTKELGMFNVVSSATIKNLILDASCTIESGDCTAALIGCCNGSGVLAIENVGIECNVKGTGPNAAAFVGCNYGGIAIQIKNCYNTGNISANRESAVFSGWFGNNSNAKVENCWSTGKVTGLDGSNSLGRGIGAGQFVNTYDLNSENAKIDATVLAGYDNSWLTSGRLCYVLNGDQSTIGWYQNLTGTVDAYPVPFATHSQVYANGQLKCDGTSAGGELTYSNESSAIIPPHSFDGGNGWCTVCGSLNENYLTADAEGYYSIGNANDLYWFTDIVEKVNHGAKAKLTADIDYTAKKQGFIGRSTSTAFAGTFDGQEHTITIDIVNISNGRTGLFAYINAATIKNLVVEGNASSAGNNCVGGLGGRSDGDGTLIENVVVKTAVSYTGSNGDATCAGFFANMEGTVTLKNCAFYGSINTGTAEGNGGLVGWAGGGSNNKYINCLVAPTSYTQNGNSADFARNNPTTTNCYKVEGDDARLARGEMTYVMNEAIGSNVWFQNLTGTVDAYPIPFSSHAQVYANGYQYCDGTVKSGAYENEDKGTVRDAHNYGEWGFCTNKNGSDVTCDEIQPEFATLTDGYYQISNEKELNWLAVWTDRKDASVSAKLTADIDMTDVANFPGLGSGEKNFTGTFDGQRHIISNMKMDWTREGVGLVNRAADGAKVMNVTIAADCSFKGSKAVAGIIGGAYGNGNIYVENCGNEGSVESTGQNAGGIVGVCFNNGGMIAHLTNVYNVGEIKGATAGESGSLSGWMTNAVLKNCYSIAGYPTSENTYGFQQGNQFARGNGINLTNCYDYGTGDWGTNTGSWGTAFESGKGKIAEVTETEMGRVFAGLYDAEGGNVWRMEYEGWPHPVLYDPAKLVLSENVPNRFVAQDNATLTLKRTTVADTWNTFCAPFELTSAQVKDVFGEGAKVAALTGADGETMQFTTVTAIEAGKAYLVMPTTAITEKELTVNLVADAPVADKQGGFAFTGIYEPTLIAANDLFVATGNKLQPSDGSGKLKGFRAYFKNEGSSARSINFVVDGGETTGIIAIDGTVIENGSAYTLGGQRVAQPTKGLYIVNGKKVVVK